MLRRIVSYFLFIIILTQPIEAPAAPDLSSKALAGSGANSLLPQVDKRVELVSIACRLAAINGFNDNLNPSYSKAIDKHFEPYRNHPLIKYLRDLKPKLDESAWEIPAVAVHLSQPPKLAPLLDFTATANADEWESRELFNAKFVTLLQKFYRDARVESFFEQQQTYFESVDREYVKQGVELNKEWIGSFFGLKTTEDYYAIVALGIRQGAYLRVNFPQNYRHTITIFETTSFDDHGLPTTFKNQVFPRMMLHEYIHAFTNQLIDKGSDQLRVYAEAILKNPKVAKAVENTFYANWRYILYESLVRACSIKYFGANKGISSDIEKEIAAQEKAGFLWMRGLVEQLDLYEANRKEYKTLEQFMPQIELFFKNVSKRWEP
ncbi:MAG TPA: DUF4932 domain-containing protein [Pyrinomonadaceae bacterium]|jgi:hypothetical protein|nr:DUF4932 domain-containing protein [Pyrinomonadaceae bacterium]